jgi:hypothetical protein
MALPAKTDTTEATVSHVVTRPKRKPHSQATKEAVLMHYQQIGRLDLACEKAGVHRRTHYDWLESDPEYRIKFQACRRQVIQLLEDEAWRRAVEGVSKPISVNGKIKTIREYSDTLLIFLLKGAAPEKYRERYEPAVGSPGAGQSLKIEIVRVLAKSEIEAPADRPEPDGRVIEARPLLDKPN